jgi:hypothetical protein
VALQGCGRRSAHRGRTRAPARGCGRMFIGCAQGARPRGSGKRPRQRLSVSARRRVAILEKSRFAERHGSLAPSPCVVTEKDLADAGRASPAARGAARRDHRISSHAWAKRPTSTNQASRASGSGKAGDDLHGTPEPRHRRRRELRLGESPSSRRATSNSGGPREAGVVFLYPRESGPWTTPRTACLKSGMPVEARFRLPADAITLEIASRNANDRSRP